MSKISIKYVGKQSELVGKTLWEIVGNLKDFGVGRIIVRNSYANRYAEPCFMRIREVKAEPNEVPPKIQMFRWPNDFRDKDVSLQKIFVPFFAIILINVLFFCNYFQKPRRVRVLCDYVFRGVKFDEPHWVSGSSCLPDFSLVPKNLEKKYVHTKTWSQKVEENILPKYIELPPLLETMLKNNGVEDLKAKTIAPTNEASLYRVAKDGEQPTKEFESGFGTPKSPNLYKNVNYDV